MKRQKRRVALALALAMLLTPVIALATFNPNNVDISLGNVTVGAVYTSQN